MIITSAFGVASRFIGVKEVPGSKHNPQIMAMLRLDDTWPVADEVPWCSAFINYVCWLLGLPRSRSLRARSWLKVGIPIEIERAIRDSDIVIIKRGGGPGPEVITAPGHVMLYSHHDDNFVYGLGGNQGDRVSIAPFHVSNLLGVRRLN